MFFSRPIRVRLVLVGYADSKLEVLDWRKNLEPFSASGLPGVLPGVSALGV